MAPSRPKPHACGAHASETMRCSTSASSIVASDSAGAPSHGRQLKVSGCCGSSLCSESASANLARVWKKEEKWLGLGLGLGLG